MKIPRSVISQKQSLYIRTRMTRCVFEKKKTMNVIIASRCCDSNCNRYWKKMDRGGKFRWSFYEKKRNKTRTWKVVTHGGALNLITSCDIHGRVAPFSSRAQPTTIKKICGMVGRKNKVYIARKKEKGIREQERWMIETRRREHVVTLSGIYTVTGVSPKS